MIQYAHKTGKITEDQAKKIKLTLKLYWEKQAYKEFRSNFIEKNKN
jgi:hypothetical protein